MREQRGAEAEFAEEVKIQREANYHARACAKKPVPIGGNIPEELGPVCEQIVNVNPVDRRIAKGPHEQFGNPCLGAGGLDSPVGPIAQGRSRQGEYGGKRPLPPVTFVLPSVPQLETAHRAQREQRL